MSLLQTFLLMIGAFLAAFAILLLVVFFWIRRKLRGWAEKIGESIEKYAAVGMVVPPFRIHLKRTEEPSWMHEDDVEQLSAALEEAGFQRIGDFQADEMPGIALRALTDTRRRIYAVVYDHFQVGAWFDLVCRYGGERGNERNYTFTTAAPTGLKNPPFLVIEHHPDAEPQELLEHCLATRPKEQPDPTPPDQFTARFEESHAREMDWRAERGGPSEEEIRAIAAKDGTEPDAEMIEYVREAWRGQTNQFFTEQLRAAYMDQAGVSARRWEEIRDRLFFVHDRLTEEDLLEPCEMALADEIDNRAWDENDENGDGEEDPYEQELERRRAEVRQMIQGLPPRPAFVKINETLPKKYRYERIGELKQPLTADVYLEPNWEEE